MRALDVLSAHLLVHVDAQDEPLTRIQQNERGLALERKNFLFVGTDHAGENLAGLYSLIATCEVNGVNPVAYLADVLITVQTHPAARIDELLPHRWRPPSTAPPASSGAV